MKPIVTLLPGKKDPQKGAKQGKTAVHPSAPAGGGGPGHFKDAHCLNGPSPESSSTCATPPAKRHVAPTADGATTPKAVPQPPPVTATSRSLLLSKKTDLQEIEVYVEILEDTTNPDLATGTAKTSFSPETVQLVMPEYEFVGHKITKFDGKFELKGKITIQTAYGPGAKATDLSGYGRGTTPEDEKNGDVTLGFHESCHREDFLEYLRTHPFPEFSPRVGMLVVQYQAADRKFQSEFRKYPQDINDYSAKRTDEVGYKESQYDKYGPRKP